MRASGTTTLGFIVWTLAVSLLGWLFGLLYSWWKQRRPAIERRSFRQLIASSISTPLATLSAIAAITIVTWAVFVARTVYFDHMGLANAHASELQRNAQLMASIACRHPHGRRMTLTTGWACSFGSVKAPSRPLPGQLHRLISGRNRE
jgi:hypothetical protein